MSFPNRFTRGVALLALVAGLAGSFEATALTAPSPATRAGPTSTSFACHWVTDPYVGWVYVCRPGIT